MRKFRVTIKGLAPGLLMNRFGEDEQEKVSEGYTDVAPPTTEREIDAETRAYRLPDGELYTPSTHIMGCTIKAAGHKKIGRRSAATLAAGCIFVTPLALGHDRKEYEIDSRPVVIPSTRGRIMRHRPLLKEWELTFDIEFEDTIFKPELVKEILDIGGARIGIGDFRPIKRGPFGRFMVVRFEEI